VVGLMSERPQTPVRYAGYTPMIGPRWKLLVACACLSVAAVLGVQAWKGNLTHAAYASMVRSAHTMESAIQVMRAARVRLDLLQPRSIDPNQTGLVGSEYTDTTTSLGDLVAKRTVTNPDLAAAITRRIYDLNLPPRSPVLLVVSGSFVGGNIASVIALEALGHRPILISSLGASMFGATDAALTWLDIESELRGKNIIRAKSVAAVLGGGSATGGGLMDSGVDELRAAAMRNDVSLFETDDLDALLDRLETAVSAVATEGAISLLVNSGGSVIALGTCEDGDRIPTLVVGNPVGCVNGTPGLIVRAAQRGTPVLHLLNVKALAIDWGLPLDPIPLPIVGNNRFVYGATPSRE